MKLDYDQSRAVRSRGHTVVSAGAGSGKTTVLTERYLSLLEEGVEVPSILTLTFTRKAAAEMHQRIYRALVSRGAENVRWERALREFDDARISTLDSFTAEIARAGAAEFGIPPTFSTDERELDRICSQVATEFLFSNANNAVLSRLASERSAEQLLSEGLKELALQEMSPVRPTDFDGMIDRQIATCRELFVDTVATLEDVLSFLAKDADPGNTKTTRAIVERAAQTPGLGDLSVPELLDAVEWISEQTAPGKLKSESAQAIKENFLVARDHVHTLQECAVLLNAEAELRELYTLLAGLQDKVRARKRSSGFLSFHDVMELAIAVLEHSEPVRAWYRSRISHIMIDEFQDNNERQKYLLELLSGGDGEGAGELFFVGDEKQSIYRFRGADVSVFKRLSSELSGRGGQDITLRTNYRSAPRLIRRFNSLFSLLLEGGADYEAGFSPLFDRSNAPAGDGDSGGTPPHEENPAAGGTVHRSGPALEGGPDDPQLRVFVREAGASSGNDTLVNDSGTEALFVVESIYHTVQSGRLLVDSGSGASRPVGYGDIAILMRSGANQYEYERMFRRYGIPYSSDSIRSLYLEAPANDMYSILQACLYPQDRYAWATFLRSPIVALSDDAIVSLFQADIPVAAPLPDRLARTFSSDDAVRYETACELYDTLKAAADRQSIAHMLHTIWYDFGYRNLYLCDPVNHGYLEYYDFLCAQAAVYEREGLAAFLDAVRPQLGQFEKTGELTVLGRRTSGVRIMSIHRSKGLEFPVVFVVGCGSVANAGRESAGLWHRHTEQGITINLKPESGGKSGTKRRSSNIFLTQAKAQEAAEEAAELRRLLYVAMTRAESHCVLTGVWKEPSKPSDTPPRSFFELLSPLFDENLPMEWIGDRTVEERRHAGVSIPAADFSTLDRLYAEAERITFPLGEGPFTPSGLNERYRLSVPAAEGTPRPAFDCEAALDAANAHAAFGTFAHWCAAAYVEGKVTAAEPINSVLSRAPARLAAALPREGRNAVAAEALERACEAVDRIFERLAAGGGGGNSGDAGNGDRPAANPGDKPGANGESPAANPGAAGAHAELPFGMMLRENGEEIEVYGAIDLVFETAERPVIVDFKTDRVLSPDHYAMQMDLYRRAAREMFGGEPVVILVSMRDYEMHEMPGLDASAYEGITEPAPGVNPT